ncbi:unnamed protein product, partial [marine sediment metagenome]
PNSVDLIVTDPPYGMGYVSNYYKNGNPHVAIEGDDHYPAELIPVFKRLAKKAVFAFCRWDNLKEVEKPTSFIVWAKNNWTAGDLKHAYGRMWEGILFYPCEEHAFETRQPDIIDMRRVPPTKLHHPTEKPVELIKWIIRNNSNEGDLILDPFAGSGATLVACQELKRRYIGIEVNEDYVNIIKKRLNNTQGQLF